MKPIFLLIIGILASDLAGCTRTVWEKPGAASQDYQNDAYDCESKRLNSVYGVLGRSSTMTAQQFTKECMRAHGWTERAQ